MMPEMTQINYLCFSWLIQLCGDKSMNKKSFFWRNYQRNDASNRKQNHINERLDNEHKYVLKTDVINIWKL